jgi:hypothetical protein
VSVIRAWADPSGFITKMLLLPTRPLWKAILPFLPGNARSVDWAAEPRAPARPSAPTTIAYTGNESHARLLLTIDPSLGVDCQRLVAYP